MKLSKGEGPLDLSGVPFPISVGTRSNLADIKRKEDVTEWVLFLGTHRCRDKKCYKVELSVLCGGRRCLSPALLVSFCGL